MLDQRDVVQFLTAFKRERRRLEWAAVGFSVFVMSLAGVSFGFSPPSGIFYMADDLNLPAVSVGLCYSSLSFAGAALALVLLHPVARAWRPKFKRFLYVMSGFTLVGYTGPLAYILWHTGASMFPILVYGAFYFALTIIAGAVYWDFSALFKRLETSRE